MNHIREGEHKYSQPPLHVAIRYAATVHAFWPSELKVWKRPVSSSRAGNHGDKKNRLRKTYPLPCQAAIRSINLGSSKTRKKKECCK